MSNQAVAESQTILGGWSPFHPLTTEEKEVFEEAMRDFVGVQYTPQEVSTQVVNGMNYRYKCSAQQPPSEVIWEAIVEIHKSPGQNPVVYGIIRI